MLMLWEHTLLVLMALCHPVSGGLSGKLRIYCEDVVVLHALILVLYVCTYVF
jgi:hypothetical protein